MITPTCDPKGLRGITLPLLGCLLFNMYYFLVTIRYSLFVTGFLFIGCFGSLVYLETQPRPPVSRSTTPTRSFTPPPAPHPEFTQMCRIDASWRSTRNRVIDLYTYTCEQRHVCLGAYEPCSVKDSLYLLSLIWSTPENFAISCDLRHPSAIPACLL